MQLPYLLAERLFSAARSDSLYAALAAKTERCAEHRDTATAGTVCRFATALGRADLGRHWLTAERKAQAAAAATGKALQQRIGARTAGVAAKQTARPGWSGRDRGSPGCAGRAQWTADAAGTTGDGAQVTRAERLTQARCAGCAIG